MAEPTSVSFSDLYGFDEGAGVVIVDTADVKTAVEQMMMRVFGTNVDVTEETPMGRLVEALTVLMTQTLSVNAQNANQYNINVASGNYLDAIGALFGLPRRAATHTRVKVNITGLANFVIPNTCRAQNTEGYLFRPEDEITIGLDGTASGYFISIDTGAIPCDYGTLTVITGVGNESGITISNNTTTANEYGADLETDTEYRDRILAARSRGSASISAITNAIYNSDEDVKNVYVMENGYGQPISKRGITIPPHSIFVCVSGGSSANIADAIFRTKTAGAGYTYTASPATLTTVQVTDENTGLSYNVFFFRPVSTDISFTATVNRYTYAGSNLESDVQKALIDYCQKSGIGATITKEGAVAHLASKIPSIKILSVTMSYTGGSATDSIELAANRIPNTSASLVTVVES